MPKIEGISFNENHDKWSAIGSDLLHNSHNFLDLLMHRTNYQTSVINNNHITSL